MEMSAVTATKLMSLREKPAEEDTPVGWVNGVGLRDTVSSPRVEERVLSDPESASSNGQHRNSADFTWGHISEDDRWDCAKATKSPQVAPSPPGNVRT